eukprot:951148-Pelagomonas_calceolata.AAC.2
MQYAIAFIANAGPLPLMTKLQQKYLLIQTNQNASCNFFTQPTNQEKRACHPQALSRALANTT